MVAYPAVTHGNYLAAGLVSVPRHPGTTTLEMTGARYSSYRQVMAALATDGAAVLTPTERELLCDAAEGYLLLRSRDGEEAAELAANVAAVLDGLVDSRRWREETAAAVQTAIEACGPSLDPVPA